MAERPIAYPSITLGYTIQPRRPQAGDTIATGMSIDRNSCFALCLVVVLGYGLLSLHVASHVSFGQASCDYCSGHSDPGHALTPDCGDPAAPTTAASGTPRALLPAYGEPFSAYRERAPPFQV